MRIIVHSPGNAYTSCRSSFSFLLKLGYLIADETASIGYAEYSFQLPGMLKDGSKEFKLKYLLKNIDQEVESEVVSNINLYLKFTKEYNKLKNRTTEQVKSYKTLEHSIFNYYNAWRIVEMNEINVDGYSALIPLVDGKILGHYYLKEDNAPYSKDISAYYLNLKALLSLSLPDTDCKKSMLAFHDILLNETMLKNEKFVSPFDDSAMNTNNSYFHYVASISHLNNLSETELRVVRNSFEVKLTSFKNKIDQWTTICNTATDCNMGLKYFKEDLMPELGIVESVFNNEPTFNYNLQNENIQQFYMYIGEISKSALLNYYTTLEVISKEERDALDKILTIEGEIERRVPMIIVSSKKSLHLPIKIPLLNNNQDLTKRKYIEVD